MIDSKNEFKRSFFLLRLSENSLNIPAKPLTFFYGRFKVDKKN